MKSTNNLKAAAILLNNETIKTTEVKNLCQMWKTVKAAIAEYGHAVRVIVTDVENKVFMDITVRELSNGKFNMVNAVKETRRSQIILAHRAAEKEAAEAAAKIEAEKLAAKKAKKAAAEKAHRAAKKAAAAAETAE